MIIKEECELLYKQIQDLQDRLADIRKECPHFNKIQDLYSYRIGVIHNSLICDDCGKLIKTL